MRLEDGPRSSPAARRASALPWRGGSPRRAHGWATSTRPAGARVAGETTSFATGQLSVSGGLSMA